MSRRLLQIVTSLDHSPETATMARVSRQMAAEGLDVTVLGLQGEGLLAADLRRSGLRVVGIEPPIRHSAQLAFQIRRVLQEFRPDVVHSWSAQAHPLGRFVAATAQIPVLFASYSTFESRASWWTRAMNRRLDRYTRVCVVNTQAAFDDYLQHARPDRELRLIRDGIPLRQRITARQRDAARDRLGVDPATRLIGVVGPLEPHQRLKDLIWAVDLLRVFHSQIRLLVVGDGPDHWRLRRYATQVQDEQRTLFLGQRSDWTDLIAVLDCLCQPGGRDVTPMAILEAMAAGVPVVATHTAGHRELVESNRTGLLVPVGDRGGMARQLHRVLDSTELAEQLTTAAQQVVRRQHAEDDMRAQYAELYGEEPRRAGSAWVRASGSSPSIP
jgi:glycosyltransferase involved in cell wall biosynthesis